MNYCKHKKVKLIIACMFSIISSIAMSSVDAKHSTKDPEEMIEHSFYHDRSFIDFIDHVIEVLTTHKEEFIRIKNIPESVFNNLILALKSIRNATRVDIIQHTLRPYTHLLPEKIQKKGALAFVGRVRTLLKNNKKVSQL